jgi:citrate lyase gamma subunit
MNPAEGGILDFITFKKLDIENQNKIIFAIKNSISNYFSSTIRVEKINVIPNYEIRTTEIQIKYENLETKNNDVVSIFVNSAYSVKQFTYEEVALVSDNLKSFCMIKKPEMVNKKLVFNYEFNMWIWGKYKLINLTIEDSKFSILWSLR